MGQKNSVLILDSTGFPYKWATWEEGIKIKVKNMIAWSLGSEEIYIGGTNRRTGNLSKVAVPSIIAIRNVHRNSNQVAELSNHLLFARDNHCCLYCEKQFSSMSLTRDHVVPVSKGGTDSWTNVVTACITCNAKKSDKTLSDLKLTLKKKPAVMTKAESLIHVNKEIMNDQLTFLKSYIKK
jgi:5-methylcytosine-specific restriction endonuclease McrA